LQFFRRGCGGILHSARAAVAENCRRCCSDNVESAAHGISTVPFAPQAHRARLVGSRQQGGGPERCNGPCSAHSATGCAAVQSPRRGHVITQHGPIATGPLAARSCACTAHKGATAPKPRLRTAPLVERRTYARRGYEAPNQPRVDSRGYQRHLESQAA